MQKRRKSKTKIVNIAFTYQFTWSWIFESKCSIYYICPWFHPSHPFHFHLILIFPLFCTLLALSEFAENQILRAVAQYTGICLSLYWHMFILALKPACNNKQPRHISFLKGSRHCKLQPSFSFFSTLFFYHHPSPLRVALQRKLGKLPKRKCLKSTVMPPYKVLNLL